MTIISTLTERANLLKAEMDAANANVQRLTQELNLANAHVYAVHGHCNEVAYLLAEAGKEAGIFPKEVLPEPSKELEDGKADEQVEGQTAEG